MYSYYKGLLAMLRDAMREEGVKIKPDGVEAALVNMGAGALKMTGGQPCQEVVTISQECVHYCLGHHVLYVPAVLAEQLMCTEFRMSLEGLRLPYSVFEVCIDTDFKVMDNVAAPGVLAMVAPDEKVIDSLVHFFKKMGDRAGVETLGRPEKFCNAVALRYADALGVYGGLCHAVIPIRGNENRTIDEAIDSLGREAKQLIGTKALDDRDVELQKRLARIVMGCVCYLNTADPDVSKFKDRQRPHYSFPPDALLLGKDIQRDEFFRLRKAHWRWLHHPRFQRDEAGRVRVVWVRPATVHYGAQTKEVEADVVDLEERKS